MSGFSGGGGGVPVGTIVDCATAVLPVGTWLECNGQNVSRTAYAGLFTAIGTVWGAGDGSTTFTLPNLSRRATVGAGGTGTAALGAVVGDVGGIENETAPLPAHTHTYSFENSGSIGTASPSGGQNSGSYTNNTSSAGSGGAHNNIQPSAIVLKMIKAM